jgi:hypothetical protein
MHFLFRDCDPSVAQDRSLPYTAYLVEYLQDGMTKFDLVMSGKRVEIFDHYWDLYRHDLISITQSEGRMNPKLYNPNQNSKKKK